MAILSAPCAKNATYTRVGFQSEETIAISTKKTFVDCAATKWTKLQFIELKVFRDDVVVLRAVKIKRVCFLKLCDSARLLAESKKSNRGSLHGYDSLQDALLQSSSLHHYACKRLLREVQLGDDPHLHLASWGVPVTLLRQPFL